jgi:hypothetical protein
MPVIAILKNSMQNVLRNFVLNHIYPMCAWGNYKAKRS